VSARQSPSIYAGLSRGYGWLLFAEAYPFREQRLGALGRGVERRGRTWRVVGAAS